ncbi:response regulator transcription factor [Povalibacter sp.]|uniref:response regulator transcription factor n=1 Tax=Povalibacter sp. TaxID=1962978 RepID=UPI0032C24356
MAVDDHPLLLDGIKAALSEQPDMKLIAEVMNGRDAIEQFRLHRPDVTLMDLRMPGMGGLQTLREILTEWPDARIVILTTYRGDAQVMSALKSGARGFMLKGMMRKELRETIRSVYAGRRVVPSEIAFELAQHAGDDVLSPREVQVLRELARGNANREIAETLKVTESTVKAHMKSIIAKLGAKDRTHAVMLALKRGILEV